MSARCMAYRAGDRASGFAWGVQEGAGKRAGGVYDAMFTKPTAGRLAELCNTMPNGDWHAHSAVLKREGFDLSDPTEARAAGPGATS